VTRPWSRAQAAYLRLKRRDARFLSRDHCLLTRNERHQFGVARGELVDDVGAVGR
jgi:hypothetical protein